MTPITYIELQNTPIFKQLELEEALLRAHNENFCLINTGTPSPAVVMGISAPIEDHLNTDYIKAQKIDVIKRFSGGGTVVVDENTVFITFIFNHKSLPIHPFPEPILKWAASIYSEVFPFEQFALKENDFVLAEKKFGGNAKYIQKDRWLLHTSFLWDYSKELMQCLKIPSKRPAYREDRNHQDFLITLNKLFSSPLKLKENLRKTLDKNFKVTQTYDKYPNHFLEKPHRKSTQLLNL